jgi:hypothetical protein
MEKKSFIIRKQVEVTNLDWLVAVFQDIYNEDWTVEQVDTCLAYLSKMVGVEVFDGFLQITVPFENIPIVHELQMYLQVIKTTLGEYANPLKEHLWHIEQQISVWGGLERRKLSERKLCQALREAGCEEIIHRMQFYDDTPACWKLFEVY